MTPGRLSQRRSRNREHRESGTTRRPVLGRSTFLEPIRRFGNKNPKSALSPRKRVYSSRMLRYRATTPGEWETIIHKEFSNSEVSGIERDFTGDIDVLALPGGIWMGDLRAGMFDVEHDPKGRFRPVRDELMIVMHRSGATGQLRHRGRQSAVVRGGAVSVDLEKPYLFGYSSHLDQTILKLPRHLIAASCFDNAGLSRSMNAASSTRLLVSTLDELRLVSASLSMNEATTDRFRRMDLQRELEVLSLSLRDLVSFSFGGDRRIDLRTDPRAQAQLAKDFIEANYWNASIRSEDIAAVLRVSTRRLSKIFEASGTSPAAYLRDLRLDKATSLMDTADDAVTMTDIAYRVGFGDISTFGRAFKRRFGYAPSEHRTNSNGASPTAD